MEWESERLVYRYLRQQDLGDFFRIYGDAETHRFNPHGPYPDLDYAQASLTRRLNGYVEHGFGDWAVAEKAEPARIIGFGGIAVSQFDGRQTINLGYRFAPDAWGKGYATELSRRAVRFGFEDVGVDEIVGVVRENHLASRRVLEKAGLRFLKKVCNLEGLTPSLMYNLNRQDWTPPALGRDPQ